MNKIICWLFGHKAFVFPITSLEKEGESVKVRCYYFCFRCCKELDSQLFFIDNCDLKKEEKDK